MAKEFFRPRPAQRRGGFKLVVDTLYRDAAGEVSSGFTFDRDVLEAFVRRIYEKDFHPMTDIELQMFRAVWDTLDIATDKGFGKRPADDPDHDFYEELKRNNAVFAAFKVHRMQNDMVALRAVMRLGWEIPNPINAYNAGLENAFPFAVYAPAGG